MPPNSVLPDNPQRICVVCDCGEKVVANSMRTGKRPKWLTCPSCGQVVAVPRVRAGIVATPTRAVSQPHPETEPHPNTGNRRLMIVLWSLPVAVVVVIAAGAFIHFDAKWRQQARIDAANTEVRESVTEADGWLKQGSAQDGENVEHRLMKAIAANDVSEQTNADAVLETVRTRRAELAADSLFVSAKTLLDTKSIVEAVGLLQRYVADSRATKKPEAEQLLADFDVATSESAAIDTLVAMSDERFVQFRDTGKLDDGEITHPVLVEIQATTLRRNLEIADQRREENKIAEANRQQEELAMAEAARQASERLALEAARRAVDDKLRGAGVWRHKPGNEQPAEMTLLPNGKINNPDGQSTWTLTGNTLVLRWANPGAPGGFWIDTCTLSDDGATYRGVNQGNRPIAGWKVNPPVAAKELSAEDAAALIRAKLVGYWRWGDLEPCTIQFAQDGTFVAPASGGQGFGYLALWRVGLWRVEQDGTIRLSGDRRFDFPVVTMNLNEDKISVEDTRARTKAVASRFTVAFEITEANVAGVWTYIPQLAEYSREITLLPDGKIDDPAGGNTWTLNGTTLVLRWSDHRGSSIDSFTLWFGPGGKRLNCSGVNQRKALIGGYKGNLPPWFDKRRQEIVAGKINDAQATRERRARLAEAERMELEEAGRRAASVWNASGPKEGPQPPGPPVRRNEERRDGMGTAGTAAGTQGGGAKPSQ